MTVAVVAESEEMADGAQERVGVGVFQVLRGHLNGSGASARLVGHRSNGGSRPVQELVLEPHEHVLDGLAVVLGEGRPRREEGVQLSATRSIGLATELS